MSYLISSDYLRMITDVTLQQVIAGNAYLQTSAELAAIKEVSSFLKQKYDTAGEFADTLLYSDQAVYKAGQRVYREEDGKQVLYYAKFPKEPFDFTRLYNAGDQVFYKDATYTALQPSVTLTHEASLQYGNTASLPASNVFPDNPVSGPAYWRNDGAYSVPAGKIADAAYFVKGDNRDQLLLMYVIDVTVYHLYCRVAPKAIPETRVDRYNAALSWCRNVMRGDVSSDLQRIQPPQGNRIRWGSNIKNNNAY